MVCVDCFTKINVKFAPYGILPLKNVHNTSSYKVNVFATLTCNDNAANKFVLHASARSLANRHRKKMELNRLVRKRKLSTTERYEDLVRMNIRNDKCNTQLSRLPVSPNTNLNHLVPFKTIRYLRSYEPLNPRPILRTVGYQFKEIPDPTLTSERARAIVEAGLPLAERFERVYPYDKRLRVEDARGMGIHSRRETEFPLTGDPDSIPTPMDSIKSHMEWQKRMLDPKHRPLPLKNYEPLYNNIQIDMNRFYAIRQRLIEFVNQITNAVPGIIPDYVLNTVNVPRDVKWSKTLDEAVDEGDILLNPHYFGKEDYFQHPFYGDPPLPSDIKNHLDEYNSNNPRKKITYDMLLSDTIYCHSNGTIMKLIENSPPYGGEAEDFPHKDPWEPRFIIQVKVIY